MEITIITICVLLLLAFIFDISSSFTRIPSVILLLFLGWSCNQIAGLLQIQIPDLNPLFPFLGTLGLILIVLEGSLELEIHRSKVSVIRQSFLSALVPMILSALFIALTFYYFIGSTFKICLINAIPFCVISSSIAIPSVRNLSVSTKEFIIYESSLSDILGVLFFNFFAINEYFNVRSFGNFSLQILVISVVSFISVLALSFILSRIKHRITFTPIILLVVLIFAISKFFHLPSLIFILVFGLFLGNLDKMKRFWFLRNFRPEKLETEVYKFKGITYEVTFLIRSLFFILFGFLMKTNEILNIETLPFAVLIVLVIMSFRWITLKIFKLPLMPLLFITPRGLITILLFLTITPEQALGIVNKSLIIQTIVISVLIMMLGLFITKNKGQIEY
jgi:NhaP-type Na+/H+ or K+/H+ antiporter